MATMLSVVYHHWCTLLGLIHSRLGDCYSDLGSESYFTFAILPVILLTSVIPPWQSEVIYFVSPLLVAWILLFSPSEVSLGAAALSCTYFVVRLCLASGLFPCAVHFMVSWFALSSGVPQDSCVHFSIPVWFRLGPTLGIAIWHVGYFSLSHFLLLAWVNACLDPIEYQIF